MAFRLDCILLVLGLLLLANSGSANLRCWDCASNVNSMCGDPMNTTDHQITFHTKLCGAGPYDDSRSICRKIVKKDLGKTVVIRQCSTPHHDEVGISDGPCGPSATNGRSVVESCHICSTDLCNSGSSASATHLLIGGVLLLAGQRLLHSKYNL